MIAYIFFHAGELPWRVDITSLGVSEFHFQVNVTDSLNLTDSAIIEYEGMPVIDNIVHCFYECCALFLSVGPLVLDCSLNAELEIECTSSNQLAPNLTVCSFNGDPCVYIPITKLSSVMYIYFMKVHLDMGSM